MAKRAHLIRPSELARFWGVHPKTLYLWVKGGKLDAVRTPGGQFRVGPEAVLVLAREHDLPVPPFVGATKPQVVMLGTGPAWVDSVRRRLRGDGFDVRRFEDPYEGLVATVLGPPEAVLLVHGEHFDALLAARAIRRADGTKHVRIAVAGVPEPALRARRAGVDVCLEGGADEVTAAMQGLLGRGVRRERLRTQAG